MKIIATLLSILFLLSSCYSYKEVDTSKHKFELGKRYKIRHQDKFYKGKLLFNSKDTITLKKTPDSKLSFSKNKVETIKKGKFSIVKTILFPVAYVGVGFVFVAIALANK